MFFYKTLNIFRSQTDQTMSSLFAFVLVALSLASAKIAIDRAITVSRLLKLFVRVMVLFLVLCAAINLVLDQTDWLLLAPSNIPHYNDPPHLDISPPIPHHFHSRGLTAEEDDDDGDDAAEDGAESDSADWELPANLWREKEEFTTLSPDELEENAKEWSMEGIVP